MALFALIALVINFSVNFSVASPRLFPKSTAKIRWAIRERAKEGSPVGTPGRLQSTPRVRLLDLWAATSVAYSQLCEPSIMTQVSGQDVESAVLGVLRSLAPDIPHIAMEHRLIKDLKLVSDDDAQAIVDVQWKFRVKIPAKEWRSVETVRDMVDVFCKHLVK
jgi:acyl carrier protein